MTQRVVNLTKVIGLAEIEPTAHEALIKTFDAVMGARPETIQRRARTWAQKASTHRLVGAMGLGADAFAQACTVVHIERQQFGVEVNLAPVLIYARYLPPAARVQNTPTLDLIDDLSGPELRALALKLFHDMLTTPGRETTVGRTAIAKAMLDPFIRLLGRARRDNIYGAAELEAGMSDARESMLHAITDHERDNPARYACQGFARLYKPLSVPFLNDIALRWYQGA